MKNILLLLSFFVGFIFFIAIPETNSYFTSSAVINENQLETDAIVNFYLRPDKNAVGFEVWGISGYDILEYKISYKHDLLNEVVQSNINLSGQDSFKEEWIILGYCSEGGCTYHTGITEIKLEIFLKNSGFIEKTLSKTLNI